MISSVSVAGDSIIGGSPTNQDTYLILEKEKIKVLGVFDGHGVHGKKAADDTEKMIHGFFDQNREYLKWSNDQWTTEFCKLFNQIHQTLKKEFETKNYYSGGTTATIIVIIRREDKSCDIITANVGDSLAMMITDNEKFEFLSEDHTPDTQSEFERIKNLDEKEYPKKLRLVYETKYGYKDIFDSGGKMILKYKINPWGNGLVPTNFRYEPGMRAVGGDYEIIIAMTRALGDFRGEKYGLSHEPTVNFKKTKSDNKYTICVASDGLWDNWKYEEFSSYLTKLKKDKAIQTVLNDTMKETVERAIKNFGKSNIDDTTIILSFI